jgi:hypothetical protein
VWLGSGLREAALRRRGGAMRSRPTVHPARH